MTQKEEAKMEAVQSSFSSEPGQTSVVSDQHDSETVPELAVSRGAPLTVGTYAISVHQENVSGATGGIESSAAEEESPNMNDSSTRMSFTDPKVFVIPPGP